METWPWYFHYILGRKELSITKMSEYKRAYSKRSDIFNRIFAFWPKISLTNNKINSLAKQLYQMV